ncbi:MAG: LPXTG cell wall anchor domain-containing protein [Acidobacteria bacterium]|nr:LPXTG cell wall anchor domain-containing protein [Acidobacteriota bacterium]
MNTIMDIAGWVILVLGVLVLAGGAIVGRRRRRIGRAT